MIQMSLSFLKQRAAWLCFLCGLPLLGYGQPNVILDTDIDSDVNDVEALAMLHTLADREQIDLLGVIVRQYFQTVEQGYCHVNDDGTNQWRTDRDSPNQAYVRLRPDADPAEIARRMDDMVRP